MTLRTRRWWALVNDAYDLPVIYATKQQALDDRDPDEHLVEVRIEAVHPKDREMKLPKRPRKAVRS
jgi:hypothetical protein